MLFLNVVYDGDFNMGLLLKKNIFKSLLSGKGWRGHTNSTLCM